MVYYKNFESIQEDLKNVVILNQEVEISDKDIFVNEKIDNIVYNLVVNDDSSIRQLCMWIIWETARISGIYPASIHDLYMAMARGEIGGFTVPAINIRTLTYDMAKAVFRVAKKYDSGTFIFEIAKSEIGYTAQSPSEYSAVCLAAALKEGHIGPVFIQGDHFQINADAYKKNSETSIEGMKELIEKSIDAGFYNIDIDSSTLVDLDKPNIDSQQENNFKVCAELTKYIRSLQKQGITISIGGEIGEVGGKNSTPEELESFMKGYNNLLEEELAGISKISIQTGSSHGGVVLPDGSIAEVKIDFDTLRTLSKEAQEKYGMAGAVQHGASTLPKEAFGKFPENKCAEVHLATGFQNIVYDSPEFPSELKDEIYKYIKENFSSEKKDTETEEQFIYKLRKKALGPFKKKIMNLPNQVKQKIGEELEKEFDFLFEKLNVKNTKEYVSKYINSVPVAKTRQDFSVEFIKDAEALEGAD